MPLPTKQDGEKRRDFIKRCMSNPTMRKEFSDGERREEQEKRINVLEKKLGDGGM